MSVGVCRWQKKASDTMEIKLQAVFEQPNVHIKLPLSLSAYLSYLYTAVMIH